MSSFLYSLHINETNEHEEEHEHWLQRGWMLSKEVSMTFNWKGFPGSKMKNLLRCPVLEVQIAFI